MASKRYAKRRASRKSKQVFRANKKLPKRVILKKFANFVGKATYKTALKSRPKKRRSYGRKPMKRRFRSRRRY